MMGRDGERNEIHCIFYSELYRKCTPCSKAVALKHWSMATGGRVCVYVGRYLIHPGPS